jgi:hypothetical protein
MHNGQQEPVRTEQQLVLEASDLSDYLKADKKGVMGVVLGFGNAHIITWPYTTLPKLREGTIPAAWIMDSEPGKSAVKSETLRKGVPMTDNPVAPTPTAKPRLVLRTATTDDIFDMAESGSEIGTAGEPLAEMDSEYQAGGKP